MKKTDSKNSKTFEQQVLRSVTTIVIFVLVYLILLSSAIFLAGMSIAFGFMLGVAVPSLVTIGLAIGLAGAGVFVLVFLLKFLFKRHKVDRSELREIKRFEEPELFQMLDEIVAQVGTKHPKRVYLSNQVNASVFYDSGFWSMFFPIEKNLEIGLGLVNSVTKSELKAILAHEFGHFSQRSMKVGSYVYQVNQVIFNMLYDNKSFDDAVSSWAQTSALFALPIMGAYRIIQGIQWVLVQMYGVVNFNYMALSREMEFHADEIAASITGAKPLKTSLLRLGFSNDSHQATLQFYADNASNYLQTKNIFHSHATCMNQLAKRNGLTFENDLPRIDFEDLNKFNRSKLVVKDQWASHPSNEERIQRLASLNLPTPTLDCTPANNLFRNLLDYQEFFSNQFFSFFEDSDHIKQLSIEQFEEKLLEQWNKNTFSTIYNDYYEHRNIEPFDLNGVSSEESRLDLDEIYSSSMLELVYTASSMNQDIQTLRFISENPKSVKSFDYDGEKFGSKASKYLIERLEKEYSSLNARLLRNEQLGFAFFHRLEQNKIESRKLKQLYQRCFDFHNSLGERLEILNKINTAVQFMAVQTAYEEILEKMKSIKNLEIEFKDALLKILELDYIHEFLEHDVLDKQVVEDIQLYCSKDWEYFGASRYLDDNLDVFYKTINLYHFLLGRLPFLLKKDVLDYQASLLSLDESEKLLNVP